MVAPNEEPSKAPRERMKSKPVSAKRKEVSQERDEPATTKQEAKSETTPAQRNGPPKKVTANTKDRSKQKPWPKFSDLSRDVAIAKGVKKPG